MRKVLADAKVNILAVLSSTAGEKAYGTVSKGAKKSVLYFAMSSLESPGGLPMPVKRHKAGKWRLPSEHQERHALCRTSSEGDSPVLAARGPSLSPMPIPATEETLTSGT